MANFLIEEDLRNDILILIEKSTGFNQINEIGTVIKLHDALKNLEPAKEVKEHQS